MLDLEIYSRSPALIKNRKWRKALEFFERIIAQDQGCGEGHAGAAYCLWRLGEKEAALAEAEWAQRLPFQKDEAWWLIQLAYIFSETGALDAAKSAYERSLALDSNRALAWVFLAVVNTRLGLEDAALENYEKAEALEPLNAITFAWRGKLLVQRNDLKAALENFEQAVRLNPEECDSWVQLLWLSQKLDKYAAAQQAIPRIPSKCRESCEVARQMAYLYTHWKEGRQVVPELERVLKHKPGDLKTRLWLAQVLDHLLYSERWWAALEPAIKHYRVVLQSQPENLEVLGRLAVLSVYAADEPAAREMSSRLLALQPGNKQALCVRDAPPGAFWWFHVPMCWRKIPKPAEEARVIDFVLQTNASLAAENLDALVTPINDISPG